MTVHMFDIGDRVDVTIRGAFLGVHGDHAVSLYLVGVDDPIVVPVHTDQGEPLDSVTVTDAVPEVRPGQLWRSVERPRYLFFATLPTWVLDGVEVDGPVQLVTQHNRPVSPQEAVRHWGPIELVADEAEPELDAQTAGRPAADAVLLAAAKVRLGDQLYSPQGWHQVTSLEQPANEGPDMVRLYTEPHPHGLLYGDDDEVWVRRAEDNPLYDTLVRRDPSDGFAWVDASGESLPAGPTIDEVAPAVDPADEHAQVVQDAAAVMQPLTDEPQEPAR